MWILLASLFPSIKPISMEISAASLSDKHLVKCPRCWESWRTIYFWASMIVESGYTKCSILFLTIFFTFNHVVMWIISLTILYYCACVYMCLCVCLPQAMTCPHLSDATAAISTRRPSPTDRCLSTLAESRKGIGFHFSRHRPASLTVSALLLIFLFLFYCQIFFCVNLSGAGTCLLLTCPPYPSEWHTSHRGCFCEWYELGYLQRGSLPSVWRYWRLLSAEMNTEWAITHAIRVDSSV